MQHSLEPHNFSTASAYRAFFIGQSSITGAKVLWKTRAPGKCKFFGWLYMIAVGQPIDENAIICSNMTLAPFAIKSLRLYHTCWLGAPSQGKFGTEFFYVVVGTRFHRFTQAFSDWWLAARKRFGKVDRKSFDTLVLLAFWIIWKETEPANFWSCLSIGWQCRKCSFWGGQCLATGGL